MKAQSVPGFWPRVFRRTVSIREKTPQIDIPTAHELAINDITREVEDEQQQQGLDLRGFRN